jgi:hypothetical protein
MDWDRNLDLPHSLLELGMTDRSVLSVLSWANRRALEDQESKILAAISRQLYPSKSVRYGRCDAIRADESSMLSELRCAAPRGDRRSNPLLG